MKSKYFIIIIYMPRKSAIISKKERDVILHFGLAIRKLRIELGLSQEKLAQLANLHRNYIGVIERGEQNISLVNIVKLSSALNKKLSEIFKNLD